MLIFLFLFFLENIQGLLQAWAQGLTRSLHGCVDTWAHACVAALIRFFGAVMNLAVVIGSLKKSRESGQKVKLERRRIWITQVNK